MLVARTGPAFWILTEMGKRICFWWGQGTERANCCAIWGAEELRMLRRKRGWAELALYLGVPLEILTTTGSVEQATGESAVSTHFKNHQEIDLVLGSGERGADVYMNPREGKFAESP